jgi:hypothetical protein
MPVAGTRTGGIGQKSPRSAHVDCDAIESRPRQQAVGPC